VVSLADAMVKPPGAGESAAESPGSSRRRGPCAGPQVGEASPSAGDCRLCWARVAALAPVDEGDQTKVFDQLGVERLHAGYVAVAPSAILDSDQGIATQRANASPCAKPLTEPWAGPACAARSPPLPIQQRRPSQRRPPHRHRPGCHHRVRRMLMATTPSPLGPAGHRWHGMSVIVGGGALLLALHPGLLVGHYFPITKRL
jgi:hypothetical protein